MDFEKLEKLAELKDKGILTQEEFEAQKKELLAVKETADKAVEKAVAKSAAKREAGEDLSVWAYFAECLSEKYCCFTGRARRKEYFGFLLGYIVIDTVISFLLWALTQDIEIVLLGRGIVSLILLLPSLSALVRRLHDVDFSGWWILTVVVPLIMMFFKSDMVPNKYGDVPAGVR